MTVSPTSRRLTGLLLATTMALSACTSDDGAPVATDSPTPSPTTASPTPTPTPEAPAVVGERVTDWRAIPHRTILGLGDNHSPDAPAIRRAIRQTANWLDAHLTELHRDGTGLWGQVAADGLDGGQARQLATSDLASPDDPVTAARYDMSVLYDGAPRFLGVDVTVQHPSGPPSRVSLGFVLADDGTPRLTVVGPTAAQGDQEGNA